MIRRHILASLQIAVAAAATPTIAIIVADAAGADPPMLVLSGLAGTLLAAGIGAIALRRVWREAQAPLTEVARLLDRDPSDIADLPVLVADAFAQRDTAHTELAHQHDQLHHIIESLDEPVLVIDQEETIVFANRSASDFFQIKRERLIGAPAPQAVTQAPLLAAVRRALTGGRHTARADLATHRGPRIYDVSSAPIATGDDASGAVLTLRDVTDLARAARMKTDFVANASHELRTPLAAIRAALDTARLAAEDNPEQMLRFIDMAPAHLRRLEEMTRDLIDLSRLESPDLRLGAEPLALNELCDSLRTLHEEQAQSRGVEIRFEWADSLGGFRTDPRLIHLVLKNLLDNALKFCDEGSTVRVVGAIAMGGDARRRARFEVRDQGVGIPLNQQQRVFERFYQVDAARPGMPAGSSSKRGTGLGLSIVKHAVGALGGEVGLESVYQQGTTVWFVIPEAATDSPEPSDDADFEQLHR